MKLHFMGANRQVTGSRYCLETEQSRVMIDCGMFQERHFVGRNWNPCPLPLDTIDAMLVTHAHIDHCGLIPRLVRQGFRKPIHCTPPTAELLEIMLRDAAKIQSEDMEYKKKRHRKEGRQGRYEEQVLFDDADVDATLPLVNGVKYQQTYAVTDDIDVTFWEAGHILGSAMLEVVAREQGNERRIIFSGDIGQWDKPLIHDPSLFRHADYVVMESTYGDRDHEDGGDIESQLEAVIRKTIQAGGNVVIPTFAVERAQELIYHLGNLAHQHRIPDVPVYLDSPMAVDVTEVFRKHKDRFDAETWNRVAAGVPPLNFPGLVLARSTAESKAINQSTEPCVIMSTSGMCTAGRIKHHLRHNISRRESTILFVGYQGAGTLGRQILDGRPVVRIHGQDCPVHAKIQRVFGCSGHADRSGLLRWAGHFEQPPRRAFLTHGEEQAATALSATLTNDLHWTVLIPDYESVSDLH